MLLLLLVASSAAETVELPETDAKSVLHSVRSSFPSEPVSIQGTITVRRRRGVVVKEMGYRVAGKWSDAGADLKCVITDGLGRESDEVAVAFKAGSDATLTRSGDGLVADDGAVIGTALSCADLAMPFLWWQNSKLIKKEKTRGRDSYVLDLRPGKDGAVSRVRAWIDSSIFVVLKAETYDAEEKLKKSVTVKSFKKIYDQWMIKDMEVIMASAPDKTVVTVDAMEIKTEGSESEDS